MQLEDGRTFRFRGILRRLMPHCPKHLRIGPQAGRHFHKILNALNRHHIKAGRVRALSISPTINPNTSTLGRTSCDRMPRLPTIRI